ncbi:MAG: glycine cleavage system protein GcvH [Bacteroidota bacterium]|nr:glycine cleavage system protein GcvH [Bacteroidota bacterium]
MNFPENLRYTTDHEWVLVSGDIATVGVTDFAQRELGDIVFVEIESAGKTLNQHEIFGTVEAVKTVSDLFMPLSGDVIEVNKGLDTNPESINSDPYGAGWMVKIKMSNPAEYDSLLSSEAYASAVGV